MKTIHSSKLLAIAFILLLPSLVWAQTNFVGTCDQYQPGYGGSLCLNTGGATMWSDFTGDVVNTHRTPQCSPTNTSQCGKLTVIGANGLPYVGTLIPGQAWCYQVSPPAMVPCNGGGGGGSGANPTIYVSGANSGFAGNGTGWLCDTGTVHTWDLTSNLPAQALYLREIRVGTGVDYNGIVKLEWSVQNAAGTTIASGGEDHYGNRAGGMPAGDAKEVYYSYITVPAAASNRLVFNGSCTLQVGGNTPNVLMSISLSFN